jgi:putative hemolysin
MNKKILIISGVVLISIIAGYFFLFNQQEDKENNGLPANPEITGQIYSISDGRILVAQGAENNEYDGDIEKLQGSAFWFKIDSKTEITDGENNLNLEDLWINDSVSVWSTGFVLETYPAQANAAKILVIKKGEEPREEAGLANPASVYCSQEEGKLEIRTNADGSQKGFCVFSDGSECEEWKFFQKECFPGEVFCKDLCGDGICQEIVCMAVGCPCPETPETCPQDCF